MVLRTRRYYTFVEQHRSDGEEGLRKIAAVAVVENPFAGTYVEDLQPMIEASRALGAELAKLAVAALEPYRTQSYGKAAIVGLAGEQEHANALLTSAFATPFREAVGGATAWIPSFTKRGGPGTSIDIPLASKDALYV